MFKHIFRKAKDRLFTAGKTIVGRDHLDNRYFIEVDPKTGTEKRSVLRPDATLLDLDIPDLDNLPVEWRSWLNYMRRDAPTPQLSKYLQEERRARAENAKKWQEEMDRQLLQSRLAGRGQSTPSSGMGHHDQGGDGGGGHDGGNLKPSFDFIEKQLHLEQGTEAASAMVTASPGPSDLSSSSQASMYDTDVLSNSDINAVAETHNPAADTPSDAGPSAVRYSPFATGTYDYMKSTVPSDDLRNEREFGYTKPVDYEGINPSNLSTLENREVQKQYSLSRTSKYAGKRPQIRTPEQIAFLKEQQKKYDEKFKQMEKLEEEAAAEPMATEMLSGDMDPAELKRQQRQRKKEIAERKAHEQAEIEMQRLTQQAEQSGFGTFDPNKYLNNHGKQE